MTRLISATLLLMLLIGLPLHSALGLYTAYETSFYGTRMEDARAINGQYHLDRQPSVLYIDPGDAPYFIRANSSCRFISPLIVSRYRDDWNLSAYPEYQEEYACIVSYTGKYIVLEKGTYIDWIGEDQQVRQPFLKQLWANYTVVYNKSWRVLERKEGK